MGTLDPRLQRHLGLRQKPNFSKPFNPILSVQSHLKTFSALPVGQIISTSPRVSSHKRGGSRSSRNAGRDAMDVEASLDERRLRPAKPFGEDGWSADGEVVWA
jgi:hypothetical protein